MGDNCKEKVKPTGIIRIRKLTYGLIYPAFIGNMLYDLLQFSFGAKPDIVWTHHNWAIVTGIAMVVFYSLDYIHLHADLDYETSEDKKGYIYTLGDFATSCLFFSAFVSSKYGNIDFAMIFLSIIPIIFCVYNLRLNINIWANIAFAILSCLIVIGYFIVKSQSQESDVIPHTEQFLMWASIFLTVLYFAYNLFCFWLPTNVRRNTVVWKRP